MEHFFLWELLTFIVIPLIQGEVDIFKGNVWNIHRLRDQEGIYLPSSVSNHIYNFPEEYNLRQCGKI